MNISQPVASYIGSVDFGYLSSAEIRILSVKKVHNPITFDGLLNPVTGGLYDAALGAWGDNSCATCHLLSYACPGHVGHIELPVPVYHVTYMDQLFRLLRSKCVYCSHLKMHRAEIHRFSCKLQLLQHGLLQEAEELEKFNSGKNISSGEGVNDGEKDGNDEDSEVDDEQTLREKRNAFVKHAIQQASDSNLQVRSRVEKVALISERRRAIIKDFLAAAPKGSTCGTCKGASHAYRTDKRGKIFRKPLAARTKAKMILGGFKAVNPLVKALSERKAMQQQRREDRDADEGIVADLEEISSNEEPEDIEMLDVGGELETHGQTKSKQEKPKVKNEIVETDLYLNQQEVHAAISELFEKEAEILNLVYSPRLAKDTPPITADSFFVKNILVPPNKYRPELKTGDGEIIEARQNSLYKEILKQCVIMNHIRAEIGGSTLEEGETRRRDFRDLQNSWLILQHCVNALIDSSKSAQNSAVKLKDEGIKQKLEKKEGLFRKNMMGKRVNFAARSVISPDPNIETNEIGVPPVFARKLTYPEPVTNHNFYELKEAVLNGVEKWPGAAAVESENGQVINLRTKNFEERQALANQLLAPSSTIVNGARNKKVHRHLNNGDIVLMNRQPTLHKPSMMAHRARILPGEKTIRLHYANCNTYNADFDGDEMNMHFPQNEIARAEALQIADTDHQYLAATSGKPLRGLIQDHISMGVWLTNRDTLFDREDYQQLLYSCLRPENNHTTSGRIETVTPAIIKPKALWTGKQVVTTVLKNIKPEGYPGLYLSGKSQINGDRWGADYGEGIVLFQDGELLCGILDKAHLGPSGGGFIHSVYETYGHKIAGRLLGIMGRLLTKLLHMRAFSCGMDDLLLTKAGDQARSKKLQEAETIGQEVAMKYVKLNDEIDLNDREFRNRLQEVLREGEKHLGLDRIVNSRTSSLSSEITKACLPAGLRKPFPINQMQAMTASGAKGSVVNANLISCNLGQQVLEGRRVPVMVSGKTLPSFRPFETNIRAGGYITDRFLTGVKPQEYYFHAMAGREGLLDTALKTSSSGYLQRCLVKGMEGLKAEYDNSVRDSDGTMVQFLYGEDGLDVTKQGHLKEFKFLAENYMSLARRLNSGGELDKIPDRGARAHRKAAMKKVKKKGKIDAMDPALAIFSPGSNRGSISERFAEEFKIYCEVNPDGLIHGKSTGGLLTQKAFETLLEMKYMSSVVDPGEAVGIVAAQSIGEPSTQMTLNTFHLAGHSAKNVTLGIPRLREIVMSASKKPSTPSMTLHIHPELDEEAGVNFAKGITKVTLAEVMDQITVREKIGRGVGSEKAKIYDIRLNMYPSAEYRRTYAITIADVLRTIEIKFIPKLSRSMDAELNRQVSEQAGMTASQPEVGKSFESIKGAASGLEENDKVGEPDGDLDGDDDEDDEDDEDDDNGTNSKQKQNRNEAISYGAPDEEEEAIRKDDRRTSSPDIDDEDEGYSGSPQAGRHVEGDTSESEEDADSVTGLLSQEVEERIMQVNPRVTRFAFDEDQGQWSEIRLEFDHLTFKPPLRKLIETAAQAAVIQSIPGISTATFTREKLRNPSTGIESTTSIVQTSGSNLEAMREYQDLVNPHKIFTNDIYSMLTHYGVEACRSTLIQEMNAVFTSHSISVDNRHLNLIADVMTQDGGYKAFNRSGLKAAGSPLLKMSFETTVGFLRDAVLEGDWDDLNGPSGRIVVGRVGRVGTGSFDVLMPIG